MTVDAACFVNQRPVQPVLTEGLVDHFVVATLTEFKTIFLHRKRLRRIRFIVALIAHLVLDRRMNIVRQNRPGIGTVRVVA